MFINNIDIILSIIAATVFSALLPLSSWTQIWIPLLAFVVSYVALFLLSWLLLGLISLTVNTKREYKSISVFYNALMNLGYGYLCGLARLRVHITGLEKLPRERFLIVSNHRSNFDNMMQSYMMRKKTRIAYISKPENFKIPIGHRYISRNCYLSIDRENPRNALKTFLKAAELIKSGEVSIGIFPEGHRSRDGNMAEFKSGCFLTAIKAGCPVVICSVTGTEKITSNFPWRKTDVYFDILKVISSAEVGNMKTTELSDISWKTINEHIENKTDKGETK